MNTREILIPDAYKLKVTLDGNIKSIIVDQELDPFHVSLDGNGCVIIDMADFANIVLSIQDLQDIIKLIKKADKLTLKN